MPTSPLPPTNEAPTPPPFALGILAARYELLGELGHGGMAVVYHAREHPAGPGATPGREVAIKVVSSRYARDPDALRRFTHEARTVEGLDHPHVVRTLAVEAMGGTAVAIVSDYVRGRTLRAALRDAGAVLAFDRAASVLRDVAAALAYAHARRIVHRDVKPENIFVEDAPGQAAAWGRALLADFGIARTLDTGPALTAHGAALGTPTYMAPEQITGGAVDERTDVYALALVGWEMLAGRRPWQGDTLYDVLHKQQFETLPDLAALRPHIPAYLLDAIRGGLAKDPAERWRDGAEFLERLTPRAQPLPALAPEASADAAGETVRVLTPTTSGAVAVRPAPTLPSVSAAERALVPPPAAGRAARRGRRVRLVLGAVGLGGVAMAAGLVARTRAAARAHAADAATTRVSDAELAALLRAANDAAAARAARAERLRPRAGAAAPASAAAQPGVRTLPRPAPAPTPRATRARREPPAATAIRITAATGDDPRCQRAAAADQRACLMAAVARQDADLTTSYQSLIAVLRARAGGVSEPAAVRALRAEQRAWVDARDRQCRAAVAGREGALWGAARAPCFAALSARRATELDTARDRAVSGPAAG